MQTHLIQFGKFLIVFLSPVFPMMILVGIAIFVDTWYGRRAAKHRGEKLTSLRMREGLITKMLSYQIAIISMFLIDFWIINEIVLHYVPFTFLFTKIAAGYMLWIEWMSINESHEDIKGYTINSKINEFISTIRNVLRKITTVKSDVDKLK